MSIKSLIVNAFSKDEKCGNPAGVILAADKLSDKKMLQISYKLGFSESVFITKSESADFKLRFFSITNEVDMCVHATIAAVRALIHSRKIIFGKLKKKIIRLETNSRIITAECFKAGFTSISLRNPEYRALESDRKLISSLLNINEDELSNLPIQCVSVGVPKLIIPINSLNFLFKIRPDLVGIRKYCKINNLNGFYPFTFETKDKSSDFHARQFNPLAGINEDSVTGVAAGALGAYIIKNGISLKRKFIVESGYIMKKPGKIYIDISSNKIKVGGYAIIVGEKVFQ